MGNLIWHEYSRFVSITANVCMYMQSDVSGGILTNHRMPQMRSGLPFSVCSIANSSGTLLVALCVTLEVFSAFSGPLTLNRTVVLNNLKQAFAKRGIVHNAHCQDSRHTNRLNDTWTIYPCH